MPQRQKSPELQQAQLASFAEEGVGFYHDQGLVFKEIEAAQVQPQPAPTDSSQDVLPVGFEVPKIGLRDGESRLVSYLQEVGGARHATIARRAELLGAFKKFESEIDDLNESRLLGEGDKCRAYLVGYDGNEYVARKTWGGRPRPFIIEGYVRGCVRAEGIPHLEQIAAVSYDQGVIITDRMPGKPIANLTQQEKEAVSDQQMRQLIDTIIVAHHADVPLDCGNGGNLLYDPGEGFGFVDLDTFQQTLSMYASLDQKLSATSHLLGSSLAERFQDLVFENSNVK